MARQILTDEERENRAKNLKDAFLQKGLWGEASRRLDPERLSQLERYIDDENKGLQEAAKEKLEAIKTSRLRIKIGKGKVLEVREAVTKVVKTVLSYNAIISAATAAEPHANLAWGGVAALLPILSTALTRTEDALGDLDGIALILVRFRAIELIYDLSDSPEERFAAPQTRELHGQLRSHTIDLYTQILEYQVDVIDYFSRSQLHRVVKGFTYPLEGKFSEIEKTAESASMTLQTLDSGAMATLDPQLSSLREGVKEILDRMEEINANFLDLSKTDRIKDLSRAAYAAFDEGPGGSVPSSCYGDTRKEILDAIYCWGEGRDGDKNCVFWLSGMAGTGKSTIARTIAGKLSEAGILGASFFFSKTQQDRTETEKFFSSLALGLCSSVPGFDECLYQSIPKYENVQHKSLKDQWGTLILEPLKTLESSLLVPLPLVLVIDALDECKGTRAVPDFVSLFLEAKDLKRIQLRILLTSRNEKHIVDSLKHPDVTCLSLEEGVEASFTERDISVYVRHMLSEIAAENELEDWPQEDQKQRLLQFCGKLFIAAATACRFLDSSFPEENLDSLLNAEWTSDGGTSPLDDMYRHVLQVAADGRDGKIFLCHFPSVLGAILVSKEPVSVSDLESLLGLSSKKINFILSRLRSVLIVPGDANSSIQLLHLSFRDFLLDKTRCQNERFFIDETKAHRRSFESCLKQISGPLKKDICALQDPGTLFSEIDRDRVTELVPRVVQYGCQYWAMHLKDAGIVSSDTKELDMSLDFLKKDLLHWIEALAVIGRIRDAVTETADLRSVALGARYRDLAFFNEAYRFIRQHQSTIQSAPLQVYYMASVFTPTHSLIRKHSSTHYPSWLRSSPVMESDWGREEQIFPTTSYVEALAISLDGRSMALSSDKTINVWNVITGGLEHAFPIDESEAVECLIFSDDGIELIATIITEIRSFAPWNRRFAFARGIKNEKIRDFKAWSLVTGKPMTVFSKKQILLRSLTDLRNWSFQAENHVQQKKDDSMFRVSLSADGGTMALFDRACAYIGNTDTKRITHILPFDRDLKGVKLSSTRAILLFRSGANCKVRLWDLVYDHQIELQRTGPREIFRSAVLSPEGAHLGLLDCDEVSIEIWDLNSKTVKHTLESPDPIRDLVVLPHGNKLIASGKFFNAHIWDLEQPDVSLVPPRYHLTDTVSLSTDGHKVVALRDVRKPKLQRVQIWDLAERKLILDDEIYDGKINISGDILVASPWSQRIEEVEEDGQEGLKLHSVNADLMAIPTNSSLNAISAVALSADGMSIAIVKIDGCIEIWAVSLEDNRWKLRVARQVLRPLESDESFPHAAFSSDGTRLLVFSIGGFVQDDYLKVLCAENSRCDFEINHPRGRGDVAALSHRPTMLAWSSFEGLEIYNIPGCGTDSTKIQGRELSCVAFSPQDTRIATGWKYDGISIHSTATGETEWVLQEQPLLVNALTFSPDDSWDEKPFYTVDDSGEWILYDNRRALALPESLVFDDLKGLVEQEYRAKTIAFVTRGNRLAAFMFDGAPSF